RSMPPCRTAWSDRAGLSVSWGVVPGGTRTSMSALSRQTSELVLLAPDWQADVTQLLDEHHMVAWSDLPQRRTQFAVSLSQFLGSQRDTEVCVFYGKYITDLE